MTEEKYEEIKKGYLDNIKRYMLSVGDLFPHVTVFGAHKDGNDKDAIIHIPIPDEFLKSEDMKDKFVDVVLPGIADSIHEKFIPYGVGWATEAWVRTSPKDDKLPDNWKDLPIKREVLFINLEFKHKTEAIVYDIKRMGKQVNEEGDLVDHIDLIEDQTMSGADSISGRFSGLLSKFVKAHS
jgi:hypothetical protein